MARSGKALTPRQKYGEELRLRRLAAGMTQEALAELVVCSPTLISHIEAGRRLPNPEDAQRIDQALGTDGFFVRWLKDLDSKYASHFAGVAEFEQRATEVRHYGSSLITGLLQTEAYAREVLGAHHVNCRRQEIDQQVVNRIERGQLLEDPSGPVAWILLDEAALRRGVGGPRVMAEQLHKIAAMAEAKRLRLHILPFAAGAHALLTGMLYLMSFDDAPSIAYVEGVATGHVFDDPAMVNDCKNAFDLALGDSLSHKESVTMIKTVAQEYAHEQQ
ncbi:helix-turn-helix domain-containing protein [Streptomyces sp. NBC_00370]|uniref:helix-turn-helix domain-containing protein n=1 Tax=Streptomyces sp. NBC_00370 TaxID=2975728 RepID=UPI002E267E40